MRQANIRLVLGEGKYKVSLSCLLLKSKEVLTPKKGIGEKETKGGLKEPPWPHLGQIYLQNEE